MAVQDLKQLSSADLKFYELIKTVLERVEDNAEVDHHAPGLKDLLRDVLDDRNRNGDDKQADHIAFLRRVLYMYRAAPEDKAYQKVLKQYTKDEQKNIESFVAGASISEADKAFKPSLSLGIREEIKQLHNVKCVQIHANHDHSCWSWLRDKLAKGNPFHLFTNELSTFIKKAGSGASVDVYQGAKFQNWGLNVENKPQYICVPENVEAIQAIVRYARKANLRVRCSGYRHSWTPIFGQDGEILISMLPVSQVSRLPDFSTLALWETPPNALEDIQIIDGTPKVAGNTLVRIGTAVTNERLRRWCVAGNKVTVPSNVIISETTVGGVIATVCHGAGLRHKTLSELVRKIEYVDANGERREVTNEAHLLAAGGSFGLMGIITHMTLELVPMSYAVMKPTKMPVYQAIPPPPDLKDGDIPLALRIPHSEADRQRWQRDFESRCENDYYAEWFWFPYLNQTWVNTWNPVDDPEGAVDFPVYGKIVLTWLGGFMMDVVQQATTLSWIGKLARTYGTSTTLISYAAMALFPATEVKTALPNALHFQRAVQNTRVLDLELEMPLQPAAHNNASGGSGPASTKRDFSYVQRAWWDAILTAYAAEETSPQRMPLEMRITGGSDMILAPQRGNTLGTASIEVLTLWSEREAWGTYVQQVIDKWMSYKDAEGKPLKSRPHWAKEWYGYEVDGKSWAEKLRDEDYRDELKEFKRVLSEIGKEDAWTLDDAKARFSNELFDYMLWARDADL